MHALNQTPTQDVSAFQEDCELIERTRAGDVDAQRVLGRRLGCVHSFLGVLNQKRGRPLAPEESRDLAQDVQVAILERLTAFRGQARLETWIWHICRGRFLNRLRDLGRRPKQVPVDPQLPEDSRDQDAVLEAQEIDGFLERIGPPEEDIVRLRHFENLTFSEISKRTGLRLGTVKTYYYRGLSEFERIYRNASAEDLQ